MAVEKKFVKEAVHRLLIKEFLRKETERAGFGGIDIQRTPMGTRVSIVAERPGMVIGRKGSTINALTEELDRRFEVENPQIEVIEAGKDSDTNAQIMAQKLAEALERGWHFRRAGHSTVQRVMGAGAQGCQVIVSGKLTGQRHRMEKFNQGHIKYCGDTADRVMDVGFAVAKKKLGVIGCTVRIMRAEHTLPDMITIHEPSADGAPAEGDKAPPEAEAEEKKADKKEKESAPKKKAADKKAAEKEAAEKEKAEKEAADKKAAEKEAAEKKAAEKEAAEKEKAEKEAADKKAAEKEKAEKEAAEKKPAEKEAAEKEKAEKEAAEKKAAEKEPAEKEAADKGDSKDDAAKDESSDDKSAAEDEAETKAAPAKGGDA